MLNSVGAASKVFEYLDRKPEVSTEGTLQPDSLKGHVQFQNLTFSYPTRPDQKVLKVRQSISVIFYHCPNPDELLHYSSWVVCISVAGKGTIYVCFLGFFSRTETGADDSFGGGFWWWKVYLCQSAGEILPGPGGRGPFGWTTTAELSAQISAQEGDIYLSVVLTLLAHLLWNSL